MQIKYSNCALCGLRCRDHELNQSYWYGVDQKLCGQCFRGDAPPKNALCTRCLKFKKTIPWHVGFACYLCPTCYWANYIQELRKQGKSTLELREEFGDAAFESALTCYGFDDNLDKHSYNIRHL